MFYHVYVLRSETNKDFYIGSTNNIKRRLAEHNKGLNFSTKFARPWKLIYFESHTNQSDATRREKYLKTSAGHRSLRRMLKEALAE